MEYQCQKAHKIDAAVGLAAGEAKDSITPTTQAERIQNSRQ